MAHSQDTDRFKYVVIGVLLSIGMVSQLGAKTWDEDVVLLNNNRYQLAAWGDDRSHGAFVMDTITGQTKIVYRQLHGPDVTKDAPATLDYLNQPFTKIPE